MKDFLKMFFAVLLALGSIGFLFLLLFMGLAATNEPVKVPRKAMLVLNLNHPIADKPPTSDFQGLIQEVSGKKGNEVVSLRELLDVIEKAGDDSKIVGIYMTGNVNRKDGYSGWATLTEVRDALKSFAEKGKPIYAYNMYWDEASLFLASVATQLAMNPFGAIELNGFAAEMPYLKGTLDKFGIEVQVTRVGKYKSAVEPYILNEMSDANREQVQKFLGDLFDVFVEGVAEGRKMDPQVIYDFANTKGVAKGETAQEIGFVDKLVYFDGILDELKELTDSSAKDKTFTQVSVSDYALAELKTKNRSKNRIAVIYAEGEIVDGHNESKVGGATIAALLRRARLDEKVKAVVLRVNSPGGSASASEEIQRETRLIKEIKPFIVSMGSVAASGGYWISVYADEIYAENNTITGSIGVFGMFFNVQELITEHLGVNIQTVRTSELADMGTIMRPKSEAELAVFQDFVDEIYQSFIGKVAEGRKMDKDRVNEIAQGRVWSGKEGLKLGLVDKIGGLKDAIASAAQKAELEDYKIIHYQRKKEFIEKVMEGMGVTPEQARTLSPLDREIDKLRALKNSLESMNDPNGVYARMPYQVLVN